MKRGAIVVGVMLLASSAASADEQRVRESLRALHRANGGKLRSAVSRESGTVTFLGSDGPGFSLKGRDGDPVGARALAFMREHSASLGLPDADDLKVVRTGTRDESGMEAVRLRQFHRGLPVRFGEATMHLRGARVISLHARTLPGLDGIDLAPATSEASAMVEARRVIAASYRVDDPVISRPVLEVFSRRLLGEGDAAPRLAWAIAARGPLLNALVWIDAHSGESVFHINQVPDALDRVVYDQANSIDPPVMVGDEASPPLSPQDAVEAFAFAGDTYNYFLASHGLDSFDGAGGTVNIVVRFCGGFCSCPCLNAFWDGTSILFGTAPAPNSFDDIVGHEFTHGVTQYSAGLIYYAASGALNESYSDIFGETVDLTNGAGYDGPGTRWLIGESSFITTGMRNMMNPNLPLGSDPPMMSSHLFHCSSADSGGVHTNSGIGNHAYALMVDGGVFNGFTITGIGLEKAGKIEYRALTEYLTPVSTYPDNYDALLQSCDDLVGVAGITSADCVEVKKALDSVEMFAPWPCTCGDGILDADEQCDDGNKADGDCCTSLCQVSDLGEPCSDGSLCTTNDTCQTDGAGVTCIGSESPRAGCRGSVGTETAKLAIKDSDLASRDQLKFVYSKGDTTPYEDFGSPDASTDYAFCLYRDAFDSPASPSLIVRLDVPGGASCTNGACWKASGSGYKFTDAAASQDGVRSVSLKAGTSPGTTKMSVKASGPFFQPPNLSELNSNLRAQVVNSDGICWSADFATPADKLDDGTFRDKGE